MLLTTATAKSSCRTYLFHGEAVEIIVLAIDSDMVIAKKMNNIGVLRVKAEAEALLKFNGLESSEEIIWILSI